MIDWEDFYQSFRKPGFIPGYEIQNRLGGGAFGEVYKARKTSIGKPYAIKFLKVDDQAGREAIEKELEHVRHFAQIDHPNLVTIEDMGVVLGVPYLIMGYAGEDTLARRLKRERLTVERSLSYFTQVARGVLALHDRRLVHFDLKPSNVFLKGEIARVGDYGLAKLMTEGRATLSFGRGTPHYMAPEMLKNRADHRADIYSLGVILYESLTGALPFDEEPGGGFVVRETDEPPRFPPEFPIPLRGVVERALRLSPEHRFASVEELLEELGQTGRQGDSIVVPHVLGGTAATLGRPNAFDERTPPPTPPATPAVAPPAPSPTTPVSEDSASASEPTRAPSTAAATNHATAPAGPSEPNATKPGVARAASRELARGAAEVALGVWEGLRSVRSSSAGGAQAPGASSRPESAAAPQADGSPAASGPLAAAGTQVGTAVRGGLAMALAVDDAVSAGVRGLAGTVPVPPRVEGGLLRTLATSLSLGLEVLVALVLAPVRRGVLGVGRHSSGFVRRGRGWIGVAWRALLLALGMFAAGCVITVLAYLVYLLLID